MLFVNYFKPFLEQTYLIQPSTYGMEYAEKNESVLMVPGTIEQMTDDMLAQDERDFIDANGY